MMKNNALLSILPVLYTILGFVFLSSIHRFYILSPDPEYAYLFNATNLAQGHLWVTYVDHPGTPIECFAAIIIFTQHLLSGHHNLVYQDVLLNPEKYLFVISLVFTALLALLTFLTGTYVLKKTGSKSLSVIFQLGPLAWGIPVNTSALRPEALIVAIGVFFAAYLYVAIIKPGIEQGQKTRYMQALLTGIFTGFFIACKFICVPLVALIPFLLSGYKQRLAYLGISVASFFFFILPAIHESAYMWNWLTRLALHQGLYGKGPKGIIIPAYFLTHLKGLFFTTDIVFPIIYFITTLAFVISMSDLIRKVKQNTVCTKIISGLWITTTLTLLIVAKQYRYYYLLAALLCFPIDLLVAHKIFIARSALYAKYKTAAATLITTVLLAYLLPNVVMGSNEGSNNRPVIQTQKFLKRYEKVPVIITTGISQGSAFAEPAIRFGLSYTDIDLRYTYFAFIKKHHPNIFEYNKWSDVLIHWDENATPLQAFSKSSRVIAYFRGVDIQGNETEHNLMQKICTLPSGLVLGKYKKVYTDTNSYEDIYEIDADSVLAAKLLADNTKLFCNMERAHGQSEFISSDMQHTFGSTARLDSSERFSGYNSIRLDATSPYGLSSYINVKPGYWIKASVWKKSTDGKGGLVMSARDNNILYIASAAIADTDKGWTKIECTCLIPTNYKSDSLCVYLYYPGNKQAWFSNLSITSCPLTNPVNITCFTCNMEALTPDGAYFRSGDNHYLFGKGQLVSTKHTHSGKSSICLNTLNRYGMDLPIKVSSGDSVCVRVWRKSEDHRGDIVLTDSSTKKFYTTGSTLTDVGRNGWEQIECNAKIPVGYPGKTLSFYLYYNGNQQAWFDDLSVRIYRN